MIRLWQEFNKRFGTSQKPQCTFDPASLVNSVEELNQLTVPFTTKELEVVKRLANDNTPGLDGSNGYFLKQCWGTIKEDVFKLCDDFFHKQLLYHFSPRG